MAFDFGADSLVDSDTFSAFTELDDTTLTARQKFKTEFVVRAICNQVRSYCCSHISVATYTETWDGQGSDVIIPRETPITSIQSVSFALDGDFVNAPTLEPREYTLDAMSGIITLRNMRTPRGRGSVNIVYDAGYATVPEAIQLAVCMQYQFLSSSTQNMIGLSEIGKMNERQKKDESVSKVGLAAEVAALLAPFKRVDAPLSVMFARVT